jgi:DNA-binding GntR family transcriptional regulator
MKMNSIKPIARPTLREQVYHQLKAAIITLELEPGQRVKDSELAARFGVSRTPVREALKRLEDEGLVETAPGSLTRVTQLYEQEAKHAFTVVAALHALAARLATPLLEQGDILLMERCNAALEQALEAKNIVGAVEADDQFHDIAVQKTGNREIVLALERVLPKIRRLEFAKFGTLEGSTSVEQHREILRAIESGESKKAADLVEENWLSLGRLLTGDRIW